MRTELKDNCGSCRWWAPFMRGRMLGKCGHAERQPQATDKLDTCKFHEPKVAENAVAAGKIAAYLE